MDMLIKDGLEPFAAQAAKLAYQGKRESRFVQGIVYLDDLRPAGEKQGKK